MVKGSAGGEREGEKELKEERERRKILDRDGETEEKERKEGGKRGGKESSVVTRPP